MKSVFVQFMTSFLTLAYIGGSDAARILAVIPVPSYSHQVPFQPIWKTLAQRGHDVFLVTPNPLAEKNLKNLTQFDISKGYELLKSVDFLNEQEEITWLEITRNTIFPLANSVTELVYTHPEFRKIYAADSGEKFDVVMVEGIVSAGCYALAHRFDAPLIGLQSLAFMGNFRLSLGSPILTSHPSTWELGTKVGINLPFWKRLQNFVTIWTYILFSCEKLYYEPQQRLANKYLGDVPSVKELEKNMSLVFVNAQPEISFVRPEAQNVIQFGGLHVSEKLKPLPKELKEFIDNALDGFIYVSLGTNVKTSTFSRRLKNIFFQVLSNLPVKVVWKYQGDLPKSKNIYRADWFPQQSVLGHPNIKLFIYQGGLQSTEEATYFGVPLVGMPILADQYMIIEKMVSLEVGRRVDIQTITRESFDKAIRDVLTDKKYKENMTRLSRLIKDKPMKQLDHIIWWMEYVIRNKGAPHLRSSIVDEPLLQRYDVDVIAFLAIVLFLALLLSLYVIQKTLFLIMKYYTMSVTTRSEKKKSS